MPTITICLVQHRCVIYAQTPSFACCEKVIIDGEQNLPSPVSIFRKLRYRVPENEDASTAVIPNSWAAFAFWERESGEAGRNFEQRVRWVSPAGDVLIEVPQKVSMVTEATHNISRFIGMPVLGYGDYSCTLAMREVAESAEWAEIASWKISIGELDETNHPAPSLMPNA